MEKYVMTFDSRRWRIENGEKLLRDVPLAYFSNPNGYTLNDRCVIGNLEVGQMARIKELAVFRVI